MENSKKTPEEIAKDLRELRDSGHSKANKVIDEVLADDTDNKIANAIRQQDEFEQDFPDGMPFVDLQRPKI